MHINYADIFGVEPLSLNKHFATAVNDPMQSNLEPYLNIPKQLEADLVKAIDSLDNTQSYQLLAQKKPSCSIIAGEPINILVGTNELSTQDKKQLWLELCHTFTVNSDKLCSK